MPLTDHGAAAFLTACDALALASGRRSGGSRWITGEYGGKWGFTDGFFPWFHGFFHVVSTFHLDFTNTLKWIRTSFLILDVNTKHGWWYGEPPKKVRYFRLVMFSYFNQIDADLPKWTIHISLLSEAGWLFLRVFHPPKVRWFCRNNGASIQVNSSSIFIYPMMKTNITKRSGDTTLLLQPRKRLAHVFLLGASHEVAALKHSANPLRWSCLKIENPKMPLCILVCLIQVAISEYNRDFWKTYSIPLQINGRIRRLKCKLLWEDWKNYCCRAADFDNVKVYNSYNLHIIIDRCHSCGEIHHTTSSSIQFFSHKVFGVAREQPFGKLLCWVRSTALLVADTGLYNCY